MDKNIFLAKIKNSDERDVVFYINFRGFECGHYFGGVSLGGACFGGYEKEFRDMVYNSYDDLETILTKEEFIYLFKLNDDIKSLGYGIKMGSDTYNKGIEIIQEYKNTIEKKLLSKENEDLFKQVQEEEKEYCKKLYDLTDEEINIIFNNYGLGYKDLGYRDRAIFTVYASFDEFVEEQKWAFGYENVLYFDDNAFGRDLLENDSYLELPSGKIVGYCY